MLPVDRDRSWLLLWLHRNLVGRSTGMSVTFIATRRGCRASSIDLLLPTVIVSSELLDQSEQVAYRCCMFFCAVSGGHSVVLAVESSVSKEKDRERMTTTEDNVFVDDVRWQLLRESSCIL